MSSASGVLGQEQFGVLLSALEKGDLLMLQGLLKEVPKLNISDDQSFLLLREFEKYFFRTDSYDLTIFYILLSAGVSIDPRAFDAVLLQLAENPLDKEIQNKSQILIKAFLQLESGFLQSRVLYLDSSYKHVLDGLVEKAFELKDREFLQLLVFSGAKFPSLHVFDGELETKMSKLKQQTFLNLLWDRSDLEETEKFATWLCLSLSKRDPDLSLLGLSDKEILSLVKAVALKDINLALTAIEALPEKLAKQAHSQVSLLQKQELSDRSQLRDSERGGASAGVSDQVVKSDFSYENPLFKKTQPRAVVIESVERPPIVSPERREQQKKILSSYRLREFLKGNTPPQSQIFKDIQFISTQDDIKLKKQALQCAERCLSKFSETVPLDVQEKLSTLSKNLRAEISVLGGLDAGAPAGPGSGAGAAAGSGDGKPATRAQVSSPFKDAGTGVIVVHNPLFGRLPKDPEAGC
jgi:hypothetical protein